MAIVTNTFLTFSAIGNREDLAEKIYNISPTDTPFYAACAKTKATAKLHEWQTDSLAAAAANAQLEGDDITSFSAVTATSRLVNRTQISYKTLVVSGSQEVVEKAGRDSEFVYQILKRTKELKRDVEFVLTNNQAPVTGDSTTAQQLRPLCSWYTTNDSRGSGGADGSASAAATDGTQRALTESLFKTVLQLCYTAGGEPDMAMCGPYNKTVVSGFTGNATRYDKSEDKKLTASIDVYESDFGEIKIKPNRFSRERDLHVLDTSMWGVATLRPMRTVDLAKTGDADKGMVIVEYTLESRNQAASGIVADLATS
jgi:hypothetical protein